METTGLPHGRRRFLLGRARRRSDIRREIRQDERDGRSSSSSRPLDQLRHSAGSPKKKAFAALDGASGRGSNRVHRNTSVFRLIHRILRSRREAFIASVNERRASVNEHLRDENVNLLRRRVRQYGTLHARHANLVFERSDGTTTWSSRTNRSQVSRRIAFAVIRLAPGGGLSAPTSRRAAPIAATLRDALPRRTTNVSSTNNRWRLG